jgi:hypothetical protein
MNHNRQTCPPPFSSDLVSLVWPMSVEEFLARAMHCEILFQRGNPERLLLLEEPLCAYDMRFLFAHGDETTIWREGGLRTTRGTDSEQDVDALAPGTTLQTHLQRNLAFGRRLISALARQMHLESGFFSIFASRDAHTATHFDRNYNFTIQLRGEKTWTVYGDGPAMANPCDNMALEVDRLALMRPQLHGVIPREPHGSASIYHLQPGDILYVPPGFWHATECTGVSLSLNLCIEPWAWYQALGDALQRQLQAQPKWRKPLGAPTREEATEYLRGLRQMVSDIAVEDLVADLDEPSAVQVDEPLRQTFGSLLMWEKNGAGLHYGADELRFLAKGTRGKLLDTLQANLEPALVLMAKLDRPMTVRELSTQAGVDREKMWNLALRLVRVGYLASTASSADPTSTQD